MRRRLAGLVRSGAPDLIIATGIAGGTGYLITLVAGMQLGPADYVAFGVLWSSLFLTTGTLNGLQQEVARATRPRSDGSGGPVVRDVVLGIAAIVFVATLGTYPLWGHLIFTSASAWLALPLALGLVGHTIATALIGMLHGLRQVRLIAGIVILDALLRLVLVVVVLGVTHELPPVSWALVLPYAVTPLLLWTLARARLTHAHIDVNRRTLVKHAGSTILSAAASGAMISGISLLIVASGRDEPAAQVGAVIFAVNIIRAPLIIVVAAFQNYIVVRLRDRVDWLPLLLRIAVAIVFGMLAFTTFIRLFGEGLFSLLLHGEHIDPTLLALVAGSGGLVALMCLTGAAIIAQGRHSANTAGWIVAAMVTGVLLFTVPGFNVAVPAALLVGPVAGLVVHGMAIAFDRHPPVDSSPEPVTPAF